VKWIREREGTFLFIFAIFFVCAMIKIGVEEAKRSWGLRKMIGVSGVVEECSLQGHIQNPH